MAPRLEELAKTIDLTLMGPRAGEGEVDRACDEARALHLASVALPPGHVARAAERLQGCDVKVAGIVGLPLGRDDVRAKIAAAERCLAEGAGELEVVLNVPAMLAGDFRLVRDELRALGQVVRMRGANSGRGRVTVKIVLETARLEDKHKKLACRIVASADADFVQTATGYDSGYATVHDVELLRECLPETVGVKACGGIETAADVFAMLNAGAGRVGTAMAAAIMSKSAGSGAGAAGVPLEPV
jgi:deoxyribose-phosphate aldolase